MFVWRVLHLHLSVVRCSSFIVCRWSLVVCRLSFVVKQMNASHTHPKCVELENARKMPGKSIAPKANNTNNTNNNPSLTKGILLTDVSEGEILCSAYRNQLSQPLAKEICKVIRLSRPSFYHFFPLLHTH